LRLRDDSLGHDEEQTPKQDAGQDLACDVEKRDPSVVSAAGTVSLPLVDRSG
jgi:hypothetical protein